MRIAIGSDEAGYELKEVIKDFLLSKEIELVDKGCYDLNPVCYPDIAVAVAEEIRRGDAARGILICGTGIGMEIAANKVPGIRAAVCHDPFSTERSRKSNNAQVMCLGARVVAPQMAVYLVDLWLKCEFSYGNSTAKVERISHYEHQYREG